MQKMIKLTFTVFVVILTVLFLFSPILAAPPKDGEFISPLPKVKPLAEEKKERFVNNKDLPSKINILLLGLDGRKGDKNPRCDSIQLISFNFDQNKILITSIPRGTEFTTQVPDVGKQTNYLSNWCHYLGADFAAKAVEKITGIKPDYTVKLGFSQTLGIFRAVNLPTNPTLQFLRNRSYGIGDWQRSRNQAQFIKDMILAHSEEITKLPNLLKYLVYKMIETDMLFEEALSLFNKITSTAIFKNPDNIELATIPNPAGKLKELHFEESKYKDSDWQNDKEFLAFQDNLEKYIENIVNRAQKLIEAKNYTAVYQLIKTPFNQEIWQQIENETKRDQSHFDLLSLYVQSSPEKTNLSSLVLDFITEMEEGKKDDYKKRGEELLDYVLAKSNT